jgi:hypothetical protein
MNPRPSLRALARVAAIAALPVLLPACGASVRYHAEVAEQVPQAGALAVADVIDGRGYHTPLVTDHEADDDLRDVRESVEEHAQALGFVAGGDFAGEIRDEAGVERSLSLAAQRGMKAVIFVRLRGVGSTGEKSTPHRVADTLATLPYLGLAPALVSFILWAIPSSTQTGNTVVEAFAVDPRSHAVLASAKIDRTTTEKVSAYSFSPESAPRLSLREAVGDALAEMARRLAQGARNGGDKTLASDRLVYGQKM